MIENGRGCAPKSASCRSGSSAASSSSVGCSGSSAYGQNRSSGRYFGGSVAIGMIHSIAELQDGRIAGLQIDLARFTLSLPFCNPAILQSCNA